jgi:hypothetical protein
MPSGASTLPPTPQPTSRPRTPGAHLLAPSFQVYDAGDDELVGAGGDGSGNGSGRASTPDPIMVVRAKKRGTAGEKGKGKKKRTPELSA